MRKMDGPISPLLLRKLLLRKLLLLVSCGLWSSLLLHNNGVAAFAVGKPTRVSTLSRTPCQWKITRPSRNNFAVLHSTKGDDDNDNVDTIEKGYEWNKIAKQAKLFWEMAFPYYQESKAGRWLFAGMIGMTLLNSGVSVAFSYVGKDFWNALSAKDVEQFYIMLTRYAAALLVGAPVAVVYRFQRERLAIHWREWMTDRTLQLYSSHRVYYALERGSQIDNPDQRIAEDVRTFTAFSLELFITIVTSIIDLVSFSFILYSIQPQLFAAIIGYAAFGTIMTTVLGQTLVGLNFAKLQKEADFRYSLLRLRENAESIAFYAGEDLEGRSISDRFTKVIQNRKEIIGTQRNLEFFTTAYRYFIQILPVSVVAPQYFAGAIQLGVVSQSSGAFNHILSDLSIIVNQFEQLSTFSAGIDRLSQFFLAMREADSERTVDMPLLQLPSSNNTTTKTSALMVNDTFIDNWIATGSPHYESTIALSEMSPLSKVIQSQPVLTIGHLTLCTPDRKRILIRDLSLALKEGQNLLIVGNSGAGKSSLLRAIAGLWTAGAGSIARPCNEEVYFLPQRPYCALGSLKDQLLYPSLESTEEVQYLEGHQVNPTHLLRQALTDEDLLGVLKAVDLEDLPLRAGDGDAIRGLQAVLDWSNRLSLGEQQRLAFGRVLVNRPRLVILDEATSALDMVSEARMYQLLQNMARKTLSNGDGQLSAPGLTYISVGHRPSLMAFHDKRLRLGGEDEHELTDIEKSSSELPFKFSNL